MINEGRLLSQHGFARANSWITMVLATLLMVGGAIQVVFLLALGRTGSGGLHIITLSAIFSIGLGALLFALRHYTRPKQIYQLHENGISVINERDQKHRFVPFDKITEIYRYRAGKYTRKILDTMAFREGNDKSWHEITPNIAHAERLIEVIKNEQLMSRGPQALAILANDGNFSFTYLAASQCKLHQFFCRNLLMLNEKKLRLSARFITSDEGLCIPVEDIQYISGGSNSQMIRLLDTNGRILFSVLYTSLFSADLFIALIEHMIQNRIPIRN
ncbi:hypothetical protein AwEntero_17060 [Enterobacterales bacterium]|nr:hypothetical protein AwEntero_17060 [Enterobacterales bacterium]